MPRFRLLADWLFSTLICLGSSLPAMGETTGAQIANDFQRSDATTAQSVGPAKMGGRVTAIAVVESRPETIFVGTAGGGVWKRTSRGATWAPVFDHIPVASIGDVAISPSDPNVIWVATGEANPRNSVLSGKGVYRSLDGGQTWHYLGLGSTAHIGRLRVHPYDSNIAYVAALGPLWGASPDRGVFKTTDGGSTWHKVCYIDADTGFVDLALDWRNPNAVYACAYPVRRDAYSGGNPVRQAGPTGGIYRSLDAGLSWQRLSSGLPMGSIGRCGIDVGRQDPLLLYAVVQTDRTDDAVHGQAAQPGGAPETGGIFCSRDGGNHWTKVNDLCPRPFYFGQIRIDPVDPQIIYVLGTSLYVSRDGGQDFHTLGDKQLHSDHHALWIDPQDNHHLIIGSDGGLSDSNDGGARWHHIENLPIGQYYGVAVDGRDPYRICGGMQDNGCWYGSSKQARDWTRLMGADGFRCATDSRDSRFIYAESQFGRLARFDLRTLQKTDIPPRRGWPERDRFNWNAPLLVSAYDGRTIYFGGQCLFRSTDRGEHWTRLGRDLTEGHHDHSDQSAHSLTAIAESPRARELLYVGSDDGRLHVSRDGGLHWKDITASVPVLADGGCISSLECSHFDEGRAYVTIDRHRLNDHKPYIFATADYGTTWKALTQGLPADESVLVIRADSRNRGLLFAGTDLGLYVSVNGGGQWRALKSGLPPAAISDLVIQARASDLVIATHGRGLYVVNIAGLEERQTRSGAVAPSHREAISPESRSSTWDGTAMPGSHS
jgi:photosystem II stability/assembly factor-like uncharacterized protein